MIRYLEDPNLISMWLKVGLYSREYMHRLSCREQQYTLGTLLGIPVVLGPGK